MCMQVLHKQENFLWTSLTSRYCTLHPLYNPDYKILKCEPFDDCTPENQLTEDTKLWCSVSKLLLLDWCVSPELLMYMALSDSPLQDERGIELKKQCHRDLSAWGKNVMKEHIWLASPIWLIRPSPSAISDFHYKQPQLFNVMRFTIVNINSLHW
jgi:hypothetical protein